MKQIISNVLPFTAAGAAPTGNVGLVLSTLLPEYTARRVKWLVTVVISGGPATITLWGALGAGVDGDATDDLWGKHNDKYGDITAGVLGTTIADGTHHFVVEDLGIYTRLYVQNSAGTVTGFMSPIMETKVP